MNAKIKNLISSEHLSLDEINSILVKALFFKEKDKAVTSNYFYKNLENKLIALAFFEPSTRTKLSFDIASKRIGATVIDFSPFNSSQSKGETTLETIKTIEAMGVNIFVIRHQNSLEPKLIQDNINGIVINAGDGTNEHPSQGLLDLFTLNEKFNNNLNGLKLCLIGDIKHSRVAHSNIILLRKYGVEIYGLAPDNLYDKINNPNNINILDNIDEAINKCDVLMFLRIQKERMNENEFPSIQDYKKQYSFTLNDFDKKSNIYVMHPGPVNYGVELDNSVLQHKNCLIQRQVKNGVYIRMSILSNLDL